MVARLPRTFVAAACGSAGVLITVFWTVWFLDRSLLASESRSEYFTFENAFPAADGWLVICCFLAAYSLFRHRAAAFLWLIAAGSASVFLTGMDVLYDLENNVYSRGGPAYVELAINVLTAMLAALCLIWAWQRRTELLAERSTAALD